MTLIASTSRKHLERATVGIGAHASFSETEPGWIISLLSFGSQRVAVPGTRGLQLKLRRTDMAYAKPLRVQGQHVAARRRGITEPP